MNIDLDLDDILWGMSRFEKKEMLKYLLDDMDIDDIHKILSESNLPNDIPKISYLLGEEEFNNRLIGLINNRFKLTSDEESVILRITERVNP